MTLPSSNNDERNYICIIKIVTDIVSEGLRTIFKQEWNNRYQATLGAWDDTPFSGQALFNLEKGRSSAKKYLPKFQTGNTKEWDCTLLFDAILYSKSIGLAGLNPSIKNEVDILRNLRNEILHMPQGQLPEHEFEAASETARKSFQALGLSTKEIENIKIERKRVTSFQVLPPQPTHEVMQRSEQVSEIIDDLNKLSTSNDSKLIYFYISGNPGSGKSQLARQIGENHYSEEIHKQSGLTFVMTLIAQSLDTLLESYEDFARRLNCAENVVASIINSDQTKEVKIRHLRTQIATRIKSYESWLIIVDGVESLALVSSLLPQLRDEDWNGGQILVTTQETSSIPPNSSFTKHVSVSSGMGVTESCHLLATLSGTGDSEDPMLAEVANRLDYQPLAMAAAAVYLQVIVTEVSPKFSWNNYLGKLDEGKGQITEEELRKINPAYSLTMTAAVLLAVEKAAETDVVMNHTFNFLSLASHESLPLDVVINYALRVTKDQDKEQVGFKIRKCSLILPEDGEDISIRLHRVVHDAFKIYSSRNKNKEIITSSFDAAARSFYMFKDRKNEKTLVPHLKTFHIAMTTNTLYSNKTLYVETPSSEIWEIFKYFGSVLHHYGEFLLSKEFLTVALDFCMIGNEPNGINAANVYSNLGSVHKALGDLQQAKQYFERALDICIKQLGSNDVDVGASYNNLGNVYRDLGDLQQAKQFHERALDIRIKQLGSNHVDVAGSYNNLGNVYYVLGDLQQAKQYYERALDIHIKQLGSNHVNVACSYNNLGNVYKDVGDLQQAKQYYERALDIRIKQLGSNHVDVAGCHNNLGNLYYVLGDLQQAKQYHKQALDVLIKQLGSNHVEVGASYNDLGIVHQDLGDLQQAKQYYKQALYIRIKQLGSNHVRVGVSYNNLGSVYQALGDLQQAKQYHEHALGICIKQLVSNHVRVAAAYDHLGNVHRDLGDLQQAKQYYEHALDIRIKQLGSNHMDVAYSYNNLGSVHQALGDLQQAKQYLERALDICIKQLGSNHPKVATSYRNLGIVYKMLGELQMAKECDECALDIRIKPLKSSHVNDPTSVNNLSNVPQDMGDQHQAEHI